MSRSTVTSTTTNNGVITVTSKNNSTGAITTTTVGNGIYNQSTTSNAGITTITTGENSNGDIITVSSSSNDSNVQARANQIFDENSGWATDELTTQNMKEAALKQAQAEINKEKISSSSTTTNGTDDGSKDKPEAGNNGGGNGNYGGGNGNYGGDNGYGNGAAPTTTTTPTSSTTSTMDINIDEINDIISKIKAAKEKLETLWNEIYNTVTNKMQASWLGSDAEKYVTNLKAYDPKVKAVVSSLDLLSQTYQKVIDEYNSIENTISNNITGGNQ